MKERGAEDLIGSWLAAKRYDYVAMNELNGYENEWAERHGFFGGAFLLGTSSGFHVGFVAREDKSCEAVERKTDGFFHGVLHVRCELAHFLVTHLTPFEAVSRRSEATALAAMAEHIARDDRVALLGDLNTLPHVRPYVDLFPSAIGALDQAELRAKLRSKFLEDGKLSSGTRVLQLRDACVIHGRDDCSPTVPTYLHLDGSHALRMRLDHILLRGAWEQCSAATVENNLTAVLSDHYPMEVVAKLLSRPPSPQSPPAVVLHENAGEEAAAPLLPQLHDDAIATYHAAVRQQLAPAVGLSPEEATVACRWTEDLADDERRAKEKSAAIAVQHADEWRRDQSWLFGRRGLYWRAVSGNESENCWRTCENAARGRLAGATSTFCVESKAEDPSFSTNCDRMTATFGCMFGCHEADGAELPAFVSDLENMNAGRCLLPPKGTFSHVFASFRRRKRKQRRQLLGGGRNKAKVKPPAVKAINTLGLEPRTAPTNQKWCNSKHEATSRLCPCLDVKVTRAKPLESCSAACVREKGGFTACHDAVLQTFNTRSCLLYHMQQDILVNTSGLRRTVHKIAQKEGDSGLAATVLPSILKVGPNHEACLFAAHPFQTVQRCNATIGLEAVPRPRRLARLCPCSHNPEAKPATR
ncbi:hypothetical protein CTAYLR_000288 [Chrysophaeum taylorii]|uniref:Endonuclease/exonuclease/phosphatase domain-containing protein n=1 Tax=Chrysophaeum taylorii TaxID=2483200 RepID=A0AAD7UF65_9STRA|nr:hypothetical protein CTAYLR_000288 [Chrysophaeum taylorii]